MINIHNFVISFHFAALMVMSIAGANQPLKCSSRDMYNINCLWNGTIEQLPEPFLKAKAKQHKYVNDKGFKYVKCKESDKTDQSCIFDIRQFESNYTSKDFEEFLDDTCICLNTNETIKNRSCPTKSCFRFRRERRANPRPPTNITVLPINETTLRVSWQPPDGWKWKDGDFTNNLVYQLEYQESGQNKTHQLAESSSRSREITDLAVYTKYCVKLRAKNKEADVNGNIKWSEWSHVECSKTTEGVPNRVGYLHECQGESSNNNSREDLLTSITWEAVEDWKGGSQLYYVEVWNYNTLWYNESTSNTTIKIELKSNVTFNITVQASNGVNKSPKRVEKCTPLPPLIRKQPSQNLRTAEKPQSPVNAGHILWIISTMITTIIVISLYARHKWKHTLPIGDILIPKLDINVVFWTQESETTDELSEDMNNKRDCEDIDQPGRNTYILEPRRNGFAVVNSAPCNHGVSSSDSETAYMNELYNISSKMENVPSSTQANQTFLSQPKHMDALASGNICSKHLDSSPNVQNTEIIRSFLPQPHTSNAGNASMGSTETISKTFTEDHVQQSKVLSLSTILHSTSDTHLPFQDEIGAASSILKRSDTEESLPEEMLPLLPVEVSKYKKEVQIPNEDKSSLHGNNLQVFPNVSPDQGNNVSNKSLTDSRNTFNISSGVDKPANDAQTEIPPYVRHGGISSGMDKPANDAQTEIPPYVRHGGISLGVDKPANETQTEIPPYVRHGEKSLPLPQAFSTVSQGQGKNINPSNITSTDSMNTTFRDYGQETFSAPYIQSEELQDIISCPAKPADDTKSPAWQSPGGSYITTPDSRCISAHAHSRDDNNNTTIEQGKAPTLLFSSVPTEASAELQVFQDNAMGSYVSHNVAGNLSKLLEQTNSSESTSTDTMLAESYVDMTAESYVDMTPEPYVDMTGNKTSGNQ